MAENLNFITFIYFFSDFLQRKSYKQLLFTFDVFNPLGTS